MPPNTCNLEDMIRGKLGIQTQPSPAVTDILPLRSPGSLCSLTYMAFHSESTTMSLFRSRVWWVAALCSHHSRNSAPKRLPCTTTENTKHFKRSSDRTLSSITSLKILITSAPSSSLKNPEPINMQIFFTSKV